MSKVNHHDKIDAFWSDIDKWQIRGVVYVLIAVLVEIVVLGTLVTVFENIPSLLVIVIFWFIVIPFLCIPASKLRNIKCPYCGNKAGAIPYFLLIPYKYMFCKSCGERIQRGRVS